MSICKVRNCFLLLRTVCFARFGCFARLGLSVSAALVLMTSFANADVPHTETAVGVYGDGAGTGQTNIIDSTAPDSIPLATFTTSVADAYANDLGGVVQFNNIALHLSSIQNIDVTYGVNGTKTLQLIAEDQLSAADINPVPDDLSFDYINEGYEGEGGPQLWAIGNPFTNRTAVSGANYLTKDQSSKHYFFDFGAITGGVDGEAVLSVALTAMSRDGQNPTVYFGVTYSDGSTESLTDEIFDASGPEPGLGGEDDTFFALAAPAGLSIDKFHFFFDEDLGTDTYFGIDDVAFITGVPSLGQPGDFDGDTDVDGADFLEWQRTLGDATNLGAWEANFGTPAAGLAGVVGVPEPSSLFLACSMAMAVATWRRRRC